MEGTIVSWFERRSYGFILLDVPVACLPPEIFVHVSDLPNRQPLPTNTRVRFETGKFGGRIKAVKVTEVQS
jgi:cold shock CspA family protein